MTRTSPSKVFRFLSSVATALIHTLVISGCAPGSDAPSPSTEPVATVQIAAPRRMDFCDCIDAFGEVGFAPERSTVLAAPSELFVDSWAVRVGDIVEVGQPILQVRPSEGSRRDLEVARSNLRLATEEESRVSRLLTQQLATRSDLDRVSNDAANARSILNGLRNTVGTSSTRNLVAPASGVVVAIHASPGGLLAAGAPLAELADSSGVVIRAGVEPGNRHKLRAGLPVYVDRSNTLEFVPWGHITDVSPQIDPQTRLLHVVVEPAITPTFLPGQTVRVRVEAGNHPRALGIPHAAVLWRNGAPFLFVVEDGVARSRIISLGVAQDGWHEVLDGLSESDSVVVVGNHELTDGMAVRTPSTPEVGVVP